MMSHLSPNLRAALCLAMTLPFAISCKPAVSPSHETSLLDELSEAPLTVTSPIDVPDGTVEELLDFSRGLEQGELASLDRNSPEYAIALARVMTARVTACDKILEAASDERHLQEATKMKLHALSTIAILGHEDGTSSYQQYVNELASQKDIAMDRLIAISELERVVTEYLISEDANSERVLNQCDQLAAMPNGDQEVFDALRQAGGVLYQQGHVDLSVQVIEKTGRKFSEHQDPQLAAEATALISEAFQLRISVVIENILDDQSKMEELLTALRDGLSGPNRDDVVGYALQAGWVLETRGLYQNALEIYQLVRSEYQNQADPTLMTSVADTVARAEKRVGLLDQPLEIEGVLLDGEPFRWDEYRGVGVVVCFWQSWNPGWVDEVRHLRQIVAPYRDQGMKIVTVNLDDDRNGLERHLQEAPLSLPIIVDSDSSRPAFQNPNAVRCGVESAPFSILVDPRGVVIEIHARGERLQSALDRLYPEPEEQVSLPHELLFVAQLSPTEQGGDEVSSETIELDKTLETLNPYAPPAEATTLELVDFILEMQDKPRSIQNRDGFSKGVIAASDRILGGDGKERWKTLALLAKTKYLQRDAALGDDSSLEQLRTTIDRWRDDPREKVSKEIEFLDLEMRAFDTNDLNEEQIKALLAELVAFFENRPIDQRHLRLASQSVYLVNQLDAADREPYFQKLGESYGKSEDRRLSAYGRRIAKKSAETTDYLNQAMELEGITTDGVQFDWDAYRGQWVVVDFWATWCGPCRKAMPELRRLQQTFEKQQVKVVGVNLDEDLKALAEYLAEENLPWTNLTGADARRQAEKYGVRGIPSLMLVDGDGKIRQITHKVDEIATRLATELGAGG